MSEGLNIGIHTTAHWVGARLHGGEGHIAGVSTDTRTLAAGSLFVALRGPHHDGHDHASAALAAGAAALLVERPLPIDLPQLIVPDTLSALGRLASAWRRHCRVRLVAITGSNGKTTVKEMAAAILSRMGPTLATRGNLNNAIGVPLTLLRLTPEHRFAVIEMGASHAGEIAYLTELARPDVAVITNAAGAHLEGFGSLAGVAAAKGEIYSGLADEGIALINADDPHAPLWRELTAHQRTLCFGSNPALAGAADVTAEWSTTARGSELLVHSNGADFNVTLSLLGRHNGANALAAAATAIAVGADAETIRAGLESVRPVAGRLQPLAGIGGSRLIDDSYNANPASLAAGLEVLAACPGHRYLALGDMGELGPDAERLHSEAGRAAREHGIDGLHATGDLSRHAAEAFGEGGRFHVDHAALVEALRPLLSEEATLLIKGSRAAHMERVVHALEAGEV